MMIWEVCSVAVVVGIVEVVGITERTVSFVFVRVLQ